MHSTETFRGELGKEGMKEAQKNTRPSLAGAAVELQKGTLQCHVNDSGSGHALQFLLGHNVLGMHHKGGTAHLPAQRLVCE